MRIYVSMHVISRGVALTATKIELFSADEQATRKLTSGEAGMISRFKSFIASFHTFESVCNFTLTFHSETEHQIAWHIDARGSTRIAGRINQAFHLKGCDDY